MDQDLPRQMTVFIVEDDSIQSLLLKLMVDKLDVQITGTAASGEQALQRILHLKPDIILMDIMLKGSVDGINVTKEIYKIYQPAIIYITGNSDRASKTRAEKFGYHDYINKPVSLNQLKDSIYSVDDDVLHP